MLNLRTRPNCVLLAVNKAQETHITTRNEPNHQQTETLYVDPFHWYDSL
jgi:hypothetical protein